MADMMVILFRSWTAEEKLVKDSKKVARFSKVAVFQAYENLLSFTNSALPSEDHNFPYV
jgi:hypothetical protein